MVRRAKLDIDPADRSPHFEGVAEMEPLPRLRGEHLADLVIIGGGFTGMSTAWFVSARFPDKRIVLLEARRLANGASGRTAGLVLNWVNGVDTHDAELTRRVWACTLAGIEELAARVAELGGVRFWRDGALEVVTDARRAEAAHRKVERLNGWGIPVRWLDRDTLRRTLPLEGAHGAILDPTAGQVNGADLVRAMARRLLGRGVALHEESPVVEIEEGPQHTVRTPEGVVRAPALMLATNGYTGRLGYFRHAVVPLHSHVMATPPLSSEEWERVGWRGTVGFSDDLDRIAYGARMADGRLLFGGGSNAAYDYGYGSRTRWEPEPRRAWTAIAERLHRYLPGLRDVPLTHRWTGTLGITLSRVCTMGVRGRWRNVYYALGYSGHGVVLANLAGRVIADLMSDHPEPWRDQPFFQRRLAFVPGEPLRWVGYHAYTGLTGRSPRAAD